MNKGLPMIIKYLAMLLSLLTNHQHAMQRPMSTDPLAQQAALAINNPMSFQANQEMLMRQLHEAAAHLDVRRVQVLLEQKGFITKQELRTVKSAAKRAVDSSIINKLVNSTGLLHEEIFYYGIIFSIIAMISAIGPVELIEAKIEGRSLSKLPLLIKLIAWPSLVVFIPSASAALGSWFIIWYLDYIANKKHAIDDILLNRLTRSTYSR